MTSPSTAPQLAPEPERTRRRWRPRRPALGVVLLVLVSYVPLLLTRPGKVGADTKTYLYLDPGRLLSRAPYMWDPNVGLGTVTHQNIGYLWPMGPYYFLFETLGVPDWIAQRIWLGSIILAAGLGVRWMLKELRWDGAGLTVAMFAYALSPYLLNYAARISVILLPFAGLPWLIGLASRSLRLGGWRYPAVFSLVVLTVGGVNATSLLLVMVGPLLWFVHATWVAKEVSFGQALRAGLRICVLTGVTSLWWVAGLMLQGTHGIPILRYTETYKTVAAAALAPELLRGLGYWFFYGRDGLGPWTASTIPMVESARALALSYLLPVLGFVGGLWTRFRHRIFFAAIVAVGLVLGVGSHPWDSPSPFGGIFKEWTTSDMGLSFRSTPRAVPLIALGLSVFLGAGVAALSRWRPRWHLPVAGALVVLICLNQAALFRGEMVDRNLLRDEQLPQEWLDAAAAISDGDTATRVLEFPGIDFAAYRWGNTVDPITPGLTDREFVARELIPYGSPPSANLLNDLDAPFQAGRADPDTLAPLAQMMGVGEILLRSDVQYERYLSPRPRQTWAQLLSAQGLGSPTTFGAPTPNVPSAELPLDDELEFGTPVDAEDPPPVALFPVEDARPMNRTVAASDPVLLAGNAAGLVALASSGGLQVDRPVLYAASYADDVDGLRAQLDEAGSSLVVTDTNRRQARRWGSVRDNDGYTEREGEEPVAEDRSDNRLVMFPDATDDDRTVVTSTGPTLSASAYGNGVTYTGGDRASNAMDGQTSTAWRVAAFDKAEGNFLDVVLDEPVTTDHVTLLQVQGGKNRHMTEVSLSFDGGDPIRVPLDDSSRTAPGQTITFPERTFDTLRVTVEATNLGVLTTYKGISDVGIAELTIPGVDPVVETIRPPVTLLEVAGPSSIDRDLRYVFARRAPNQGDVIVADEEPQLRRWLIGPVDRTFTVFGWTRLNVRTGDVVVDELVGLPDASEGGVTATSSARMPGALSARARSAVDGDDTTAYLTPINQPRGNTIQFTYPGPVAVDDLQLTVVADGRHSIPTRLTLRVDGGDPIPVELPEIDMGVGRGRGATTTVPLGVGALEGTTFDLTIDDVVEAESKDWFGGGRTVMPVGIVDVGLPSVPNPPADTALPATCRDDLVTVDGVGVPTRVVGTVDQALSGGKLQLESCGDAVDVPAGQTLVTSGPGTTTGYDVDLLTFSSAAGGGAGVDTIADPPDPGTPGPTTTIERDGRLTWTADIEDADEPYWLVLGQSYGDGWTATTEDGTDLGAPTLVNGYANGWLIDPAEHGADLRVTMTWPPQRLVWGGIIGSVLGVLACLVLIIRRPRARDSVQGPAMRPTFTSPRAPEPPTWAVLPSIGATVAVGLVSFLLGGPQVAVLAAVGTALALLVPRGLWLTRLASLGLFAAAAAWIVLKQLIRGFQVDFNWVEWFERTHLWGVGATFLLLIAVAADDLRRRAAGDGDSDDSDGVPAAGNSDSDSDGGRSETQRPPDVESARS